MISIIGLLFHCYSLASILVLADTARSLKLKSAEEIMFVDDDWCRCLHIVSLGKVLEKGGSVNN